MLDEAPGMLTRLVERIDEAAVLDEAPGMLTRLVERVDAVDE